MLPSYPTFTLPLRVDQLVPLPKSCISLLPEQLCPLCIIALCMRHWESEGSSSGKLREAAKSHWLK